MRRLVEVVVGDPPATWAAAGFTVDRDAVRVGDLRVRLAGPADGHGIRAVGFTPAWTDDLDGLRTVTPSLDERGGGDGVTRPNRAVHPNGTVALDHLVIASPDPERTTAALARAGVEPRRSIVGARGDTDLLYRFFLVGTCVLELVGPVHAAASDEPARFAGLAFTTTTIDDLGDLASAPKDAVQRDRRIATLRRHVGVSVPIAFLSPRP